MATRTLEHFRAEHNVWRKDLAEELGISEEALERLELTGEVPADIAQKLTENYSLPEDYFTADVDMLRAERAASLRSDPKKPLLYFAGVSFVWLLIISAIQYAVRLPLRIANTLDYASVPVFSYIEDLCLVVITVFSGIYLGSYLLKKSNFRGSIADFEFLYPYLPSVAIGWTSALVSLFFNNLTPADLSVDIFNTGAFAATLAVTLLSAVLQVLFLTFFLNAAAHAEGAQKQKQLKILCAVALASQILSYIFMMIRGGFFTAEPIVWVSRILSLLLLLGTLYGICFGAKRMPNLKTVWFTVLPIAAMVLPTLLSILYDVLAI